MDKKIEKELEAKKQIPKEVKDKMNKTSLINIGIAIGIALYFIFLNLGYRNIQRDVFITDLNVFSMAILAVAIILFELSYKKDKESLFLNAIEILGLGIVTLCMPYAYYYLSLKWKLLIMMTGIFFAIYYVGKSIYQCLKLKKEYKNSLSDVKEIVKKELPHKKKRK